MLIAPIVRNSKGSNVWLIGQTISFAIKFNSRGLIYSRLSTFPLISSTFIALADKFVKVIFPN